MEHLKNSIKQHNHCGISLTTMRLVLSGAIMGMAITGILSGIPHHDIIGAVLGGIAVVIAKVTHVF